MEKPEINRFNIRVYALIVNEQGYILLSDEYLYNRTMTKFPGGGMNFGEGPVDCIQREAMEEFGQEIEVTGHFYTTHFFQRALFHDDNQLISIYYRARFKELPRFRISETSYDFPYGINGGQSFRWARIESLTDEDLSFPVDRYVLQLLKTPGNLPL